MLKYNVLALMIALCTNFFKELCERNCFQAPLRKLGNLCILNHLCVLTTADSRV